MELFFHGLKFYLKLLSNYYVILDAVRGFEAPFVKANLLEKFYTKMFAFLKKALDRPVDIKTGATKADQSKYGYLFKVYVSLFLQFVVCCFNYQLKRGEFFCLLVLFLKPIFKAVDDRIYSPIEIEICFAFRKFRERNSTR